MFLDAKRKIQVRFLRHSLRMGSWVRIPPSAHLKKNLYIIYERFFDILERDS